MSILLGSTDAPTKKPSPTYKFKMTKKLSVRSMKLQIFNPRLVCEEGGNSMTTLTLSYNLSHVFIRKLL